VHIYQFEAIGPELELLPLAARRALDLSGVKLQLKAWQGLPLATRQALVELGSADQVEATEVKKLVEAADPATTEMEPLTDPSAEEVPAPVRLAYSEHHPVELKTWAALSVLGRYAILKIADKARPERVAASYAEIIGVGAVLTHIGAHGEARMVDVSGKPVTHRVAKAESAVSMSEAAFEKLVRGNAPKGDVLATARIAGIMAAKRTSELIPLCHPIGLSSVRVELELDDIGHRVVITATAEVTASTGVEMEALVAASTAALTIYDMLKAADRAMVIGPTRLVAKRGGASGDFRA
jgi:cyclic pyranopterin phosphate synthase